MVILGDRTIQHGIVYKFARSRSTICTSSRKKSLTSIFSLTELGGIIGLTRKPAAEPVVGLQITDLPLIGHRVLQYAHDAHGYCWVLLILVLVYLWSVVLSV